MANIDMVKKFDLKLLDSGKYNANKPTKKIVDPKNDIIIHEGPHDGDLKKYEHKDCKFEVTVCSKFGKKSVKHVEGFYIAKSEGLNLCVISDSAYKDLKNDGNIILNRTSTLDDFVDHIKCQKIGGSQCPKESLMWQYGYNVNRNSNRTEDQRHAIINYLVENGILEPHKIIGHISNIQENSSNAGKEAREKWERDIQYVSDTYNLPDEYNLLLSIWQCD